MKRKGAGVLGKKRNKKRGRCYYPARQKLGITRKVGRKERFDVTTAGLRLGEKI